MPSQEDYLDSLLKDMTKNGETEGMAEDPGELDLEGLDLGDADIAEGLSDMEEPESLGELDLDGLDLGDADIAEGLSNAEDSDLYGERELPEDLELSEHSKAPDPEDLDFGEADLTADLSAIELSEELPAQGDVFEDAGDMAEETNVELTDSLTESAAGGDWDETDVSDILEELDADTDTGDMAGSLDLDSVSEMTEEEIEKLLVSNETPASDDFLQSSDMDLSDEDVLKMLEESDDSELQEIQELLTKSDRNEAVDDLFGETPSDEFEEDAERFEPADSGDRNALEDKKKAAQEKKELARAKRQEKKEQAAARKAEKKAAKEAAKAARKKGGKPEQGIEKQKKAEAQGLPEDFEEEPDMSVLDSIISEAGGMEELPLDGEDDPLFGDGEKDPVLAELEDIIDNAVGPEPEAEDSAAEAPEAEDDMGLGLDSLFDDDVDAALLEGEGSSDFPDFLEVDSEEADAFIPERNKNSGQEAKGKKPLLSKLIDFLSEEDEEEENEDIRLSQENQGILKDLDKEKGGKGSGGKKAKAKKEPKPKKEKPKKEPKPKKEKPRKEKPPKENTGAPGKKVSFKRMLPILLIGVSVGVLLFVFVNAAAEYTDKKEARTAYYEGDYRTCYENLFGKDLTESESVMFGKSESILYIRLWLREYEMFAEEGSEVKALDSLIQTVNSYPELYEYAEKWNAGPEVAAGYASILNILESKYGLTESQAKEIAAERSDIQYTKIVTAIAGGKTLDNWDEPEKPTPSVGTGADDGMSDLLPEEEELGQDTFIDNQ